MSPAEDAALLLRIVRRHLQAMQATQAMQRLRTS